MIKMGEDGKKGNKMERKLVFFDIDGTLLSEVTRTIPESAVTSIHNLQRNGHFAFINTGRVFSFLGKEIRDISFDGLLCGCGTYISYHDNILFHKKLASEMCRHIVDLLHFYHIDAVLEGKDKCYGDEYDRINTQIFRDFVVGFQYPYDTWNAKDLSFDKFFLYSEDMESMLKFQGELEQDFLFIDREKGFFEAVPTGYSKATAMKWIADYLGIDLRNTIAIGDSNNDLVMLESAGTSIAMGNASENIKKKVDYITKDVDDDGIFYALKHFDVI